MTIQMAATLLEEGDHEGALVALLDAWRVSGAPAIADVIDTLTITLTEREAPVRAVSGTSAKKAWYALADAERPAAFGRLLEALPDGLDRCLRLDRLRKMKRDPRLTPFARKWLDGPPVFGPRRVPFFTALITVLERTNDIRILPRLEEMTAPEHRGATIAAVGLRTWKPLVAFTEELRKTKPKAVAEADQETLASMMARLSSSTTTATSAPANPTALFARVYAEPDNDEPRAVLGDLLQQRGDPRGEHIALQLARSGTAQPRSARERALEATWGRQWLGVIEPVVLKGDVIFERGFVERCRFAGGTADPVILTADEWSTVTHLDATNASKFVGGSHALLVQPPARRSMRHVVGLAAEDIVKLIESGLTFPWETLGLRIWRWNAIDQLLLGAAKTFPALRRLEIRHADGRPLRDVDPVMVARQIDAWPSLREVEIALPDPAFMALAATAAAQRLDQLELPLRCGATFKLSPATKHLELVLEELNLEGIHSGASIVTALGTSSVIGTASLSATTRVKRVGNTLERGHRSVSLVALMSAAKVANVALTIPDTFD